MDNSPPVAIALSLTGVTVIYSMLDVAQEFPNTMLRFILRYVGSTAVAAFAVVALVMTLIFTASPQAGGVTAQSPSSTPPTVSDTSLFRNHDAVVGQAFSLTLPAADANSGNGGPYEYLLWHRGHGQNFMDQAINGLSFDAATRTLSGTPTAAGMWQLSYVVHDDDTDRSVEDRFRACTNLQVTVSE